MLSKRKSTIVGIYGGMGPLTGYDYFKLFVDLIPAKSDTDHPSILFWSDSTIPRKDRCIDFLEKKALAPQDDARPGLKNGMDIFKSGKVNFVAAPCNTFHYFREDLEKYSGIEILDMISIVLQSILAKDPMVKKVGLLSSKSTAKYLIYDKTFNKAGVSVIKPSEEEQDSVLEVIELVKQGKNHLESTKNKLNKVIQSLEAQGLSYIILGCTELPLVVRPSQYNGRAQLVDSTFELAKATAFRVCKEMDLDVVKFKQLVTLKENAIADEVLNKQEQKLHGEISQCQNKNRFFNNRFFSSRKNICSSMIRARL